MAKAAGSEHLDFEAMSDGELRNTIRGATGALRSRITQRLEEYRSLAREVGLELNLGKTGDGDAGAPQSRRRVMTGDAK